MRANHPALLLTGLLALGVSVTVALLGLRSYREAEQQVSGYCSMVRQAESDLDAFFFGTGDCHYCGALKSVPGGVHLLNPSNLYNRLGYLFEVEVRRQAVAQRRQSLVAEIQANRAMFDSAEIEVDQALGRYQSFFVFGSVGGAVAVFLLALWMASLLRIAHQRRRSLPSSPRIRISSPPGGTSLWLLRYVTTAKMFEEVVSQTVRDMREEYNEALWRKDELAAKRILISYRFRLAFMFFQGPILAIVSTVRVIFGIG